ncbi:MAG: MFS transporter [Hyphomicrobiales bacterium]
MLGKQTLNSSVKVALFVSSVFLGLGVFLPFFPSWLLSRGYTANEVAILLGVTLVIRVFLSPYAVAVSGGLSQRRYAAYLFCFVSVVSFAALGYFGSFIAILILLGIFSVFWHALIPLGDSFVLSEVRLSGANYGHIRLWGSVAFIVANLGAGMFLADLGTNGVFWLILALLALSFAVSFLLPTYRLDPSERPTVGSLGLGRLIVFLKDPQFLQVAALAGLIQASHVLVYGFGTIDWLARGFSASQIGWFWAIGVIAEVILFTQASKLFSKIGATRLLLLGAVAATLRWALHGSMDSVTLILMVQILHGFSFGATHLGLQAYIAKEVSEGETPAAQGASTFVAGLIAAGLTFFCGTLYGQFGLQSFYAMAAVSFLAVIFLLSTPKLRGRG